MKLKVQLAIAAATFSGLGLDPASIEAVLEQQGIEPTPEHVNQVACHIARQARRFAQQMLYTQRWDERLEADG